MEAIVLQHIKVEDPGYIKDLMLADGFDLTTVELDVGEKIPENIKQFDGMPLPGGITINGQQVWDEAKEEIDKLEEEFSLNYELPANFIVG